MTTPLKVAVATISRFHHFEVAAELERRGALATVHTGLARRFVRRYQVREDHLDTFPWIQTPLEALQRLRLVTPGLARRIGWRARAALDSHIARRLGDWHVYLAQAQIGLGSGRAAQARGIAWICDRSSAHIERQDELLRDAYSSLDLPWRGIEARVIDRELAEYEAADAVIVPSGFARQSFLDRGFPASRLHCLPFGVNLATFARTVPRDAGFRVLFVGAPGVQKGLHLLLQAFSRAALSDATLVVVGNDQPETETLLRRFPVAALERTGPLPRAGVIDQMSRASVLVLPSIQEGLALVQAEAMACGRPVIASENTGARDLFTDGEEGFVVPVGDVDALAQRLVRLHDDPALLAEMGEKALRRVGAIGGWRDYGAALLSLCLTLARNRGHDVGGQENY